MNKNIVELLEACKHLFLSAHLHVEFLDFMFSKASEVFNTLQLLKTSLQHFFYHIEPPSTHF